MLTLISGTDRKNSNTLKVSLIVKRIIEEKGEKVQFVDLGQLPEGLFSSKNYGTAPSSFAEFQRMILETDGILTVVPEYNGSFPGALKYFIDLLKFPESLFRKPAGFIGLAAGQFGGLRAVEQLEMIFNYREANLFGQKVFMPKINDKLSSNGQEIVDPFIKDLLPKMISGFLSFSQKLSKH
ncbi:MAG: NAD(P)H-dependent oxidoreductase [Pseudomonadota bacterium]|nr:NAD(P)H-dependent oxidoreductase [Pseudomonadota bacterium]